MLRRTFSHWTTCTEAACIALRAESRVGDVRSQSHPKAYEFRAREFEDRGNKYFGEDEIEKIVGRVAELEKSLGTCGLNRFTSKV